MPEVCDSADNDCDGTTDGSSATDASTWYQDSDGDNYGNQYSSQLACTQPSSYVSNPYDCDDTLGTVNPSITESCNSIDDDCDGTVDEDDASDATDWYADVDGDGYGDSSGTASAACSAPSGRVSDNSDCDDADSGVNPGASERCDNTDTDCNGTVDDNVVIDTWYLDSDGDGYGLSSTAMDDCAQPSGYVLLDGDCDDAASAVNPDATEVCDSVDNDCDGSTDDSSAADAVTWYTDSDGDGYGDPSTATVSCTQQVSGTITVGGDCDDTDLLTNPGATEYCDSIDNDCNGTVDDNVANTPTWYPDVDGDGSGDANDSGTQACSAPSGFVVDNYDCNDSNAAISPSAFETCDTVDNDCDGTVDEADAVDAQDFYPDADSDGYGAAGTSSRSCTQPSGYLTDDTDCDDTDATVNPAATETCDAVDNDCDGDVDEDDASDASTFYEDSDGDGYGNPNSTASACSAPSGYVADNTDCLDTDPQVAPNQSDVADCVDNDCDSTVDEDATYTYTHDADIQSIWTSNCVSCHGGSSPSVGLSLEASAYTSLVNVGAAQASMDRVEPCQTQASYLWRKLKGTHAGAGGSGNRMPRGTSALLQADLLKIENWIDEGAPQ